MTDKHEILRRCIRDYDDRDAFIDDLTLVAANEVYVAAKRIAKANQYALVEVPHDMDYLIFERGVRMFIAPNQPGVLFTDGNTFQTVTDDKQPDLDFGDWLSPIGRATTIARLRTIADMLEASAPDGDN